MLSRLLNWVPVLFGLKFAGVTSVATVHEVVSGETNAPMATSELADKKKTFDQDKNDRVASGSAVTRLMATTSIQPALPESFVFADIVADDAADEPAQAKFVARPIAVAAPRPAARVAAAKAARESTVKRHPSQVKQDNRPAARAKLRPEGKAVTKRVVWIAGRQSVKPAGANVIAFPTPSQHGAMQFKRAA